MLSTRGHMAAVIAMMDRDAPCGDILRQTLAVRGAVRALHRVLWRAYLLDDRCSLRARNRKKRAKAWQELLALTNQSELKSPP
ncbi:MAG: metal-sensing transcriptional repressor [Chloroflexi bacterium]|nr:metal-sensing transcriptional repressor [Chloroflexota bacterium]